MTKSKLFLWFAIGIVIIAGIWIFETRRSNRLIQKSSTESTTATNIISDEQLRAYLLTSNFAEPYFDGTSFVAFERFAEVATSSRITQEYLWFISQEYYKKDGQLQKGAGVSLPVVVYFDQKNPIAINAPREGGLYATDFAKLFPADIKATSSISDPIAHTALIDRLQTDIRIQAEKHFGMGIGVSGTGKNIQATSTLPIGNATPGEVASSTPEGLAQ